MIAFRDEAGSSEAIDHGAFSVVEGDILPAQQTPQVRPVNRNDRPSSRRSRVSKDSLLSPLRARESAAASPHHRRSILWWPYAETTRVPSPFIHPLSSSVPRFETPLQGPRLPPCPATRVPQGLVIQGSALQASSRECLRYARGPPPRSVILAMAERCPRKQGEKLRPAEVCVRDPHTRRARSVLEERGSPRSSRSQRGGERRSGFSLFVALLHGELNNTTFFLPVLGPPFPPASTGGMPLRLYRFEDMFVPTSIGLYFGMTLY
jgi:hypothetical protein